MRSEQRFEKMAGTRMSMEEFAGEIPSVYERLATYRKILMGCATLGTAQKEFENLFKVEVAK